jgi:hypothetical protein
MVLRFAEAAEQRLLGHLVVHLVEAGTLAERAAADVRVGLPGRDGVDADVLVAEVGGRLLGELDDPALGGDVGGDAGPVGGHLFGVRDSDGIWPLCLIWATDME